jgi:hypothetical protein
MRLQSLWINKLSKGLRVKTTHRVMLALRRKLEEERNAGD